MERRAVAAIGRICPAASSTFRSLPMVAVFVSTPVTPLIHRKYVSTRARLVLPAWRSIFWFPPDPAYFRGNCNWTPFCNVVSYVVSWRVRRDAVRHNCEHFFFRVKLIFVVAVIWLPSVAKRLSEKNKKKSYLLKHALVSVRILVKPESRAVLRSTTKKCTPIKKSKTKRWRFLQSSNKDRKVNVKLTLVIQLPDFLHIVKAMANIIIAVFKRRWCVVASTRHQIFNIDKIIQTNLF